MPRRPADQLAAAPKLAGRQRIWDAMRQIAADGVAITTTEVAVRTDIPRPTIYSYCRALEAAGYIRVTRRPDGRGACAIYGIEATPAEAPRLSRSGAAVLQGRAQEQMWQAMRRLAGVWSVDELALVASTDQVEVTAAHAADYCSRLARAGYLRRAHKKDHYRFRRPADTGPLPPMIQTTKAVWDPNLGRIVWPAGEALP